MIARVIELLPDDLPVTFLPVQAVGKSNEHISSPGTLTSSWETTTRLWLDIGDSVHRAGVEKLIIVNAHHDVVNFTLPDVPQGLYWNRLIDTNNPNARIERFDFSDVYGVTGRSLLLFELIKEEE